MSKTLPMAAMAVAVMLITVSAMAEETCEMNMEVSDALFSVVGDNGAPVQFSDIGCAVLMRNEMCAMEQIAFDGSAVVRDFYTGKEIPMSIAYFVVDSGVVTPLGSAVIAFGEKESAESFISEKGKGKVLDYADFVTGEVVFSGATDTGKEIPAGDAK